MNDYLDVEAEAFDKRSMKGYLTGLYQIYKN